MFATCLKQLYHSCDKIIVRNLRIKKTFGPNPGLNKRIRAFKEEQIQINDDDTEEFIEQYSSDFYKVGEAYNEHLNETLIGKYEVRHQIVKDKYFKENMPSLLTWSEKEQIRHLANTEPDEWTPKKIAESFPVTEPVVKKLLKYPWKPATEQRIARHDASVMRNWRELKEGSLNISESLRQHFLKFSERTIPPLSKSSLKIELTPEKNIGEFEQIVRRCAENENSKSTSENSSNTNTDSDTNLEDKNKKRKIDPKRITLDELSANIKESLEDGNNVDMTDQIILNSFNDPSIDKTQDISNEIELPDNNKDTLVEYNENNDKSDIMDYPERIRIPRKAYKKNATYKVNDCYYDHDGKFLYRVLGMTNN